MCVENDREGYADALSSELRDDAVVVLVLRDERFDHPNALLADFVEVVDGRREVCEERFGGDCRKCGFILLSRVELAMPQIASPVILPEWFPIAGGKSMTISIEDLTWRADAPMAAGEVRVDEIRDRLFELDQTLVERIRDVTVADHQLTCGFGELIRSEDGEKLTDVLSAAAEYHRAIANPSMFRPSLREKRSLVARVWAVAQTRQLEDMKVPSKALADALGLPDSVEMDWHESIFSVLRRPASGEYDSRLRFSRNLFAAVATACQFTTAAAHSDQYSRYPIVLLRATSYDLRRALAQADALIRELE